MLLTVITLTLKLTKSVTIKVMPMTTSPDVKLNLSQHNRQVFL